MPPFAAQHSLFRAYDIRGERHYFTTDFIYAAGESFAQLYRAAHHTCPNADSDMSTPLPTVVIGYDMRLGSKNIARILGDVLATRQLQVVDLGLVTTPMMAFWAQQYDGHGIMVTASHSAKDILGIKWLVDHTSPSSKDIASFYANLPASNHTTTRHQTRLSHCPQITHSPITRLSADHVAQRYQQTMTTVFTRLYRQLPAATTETKSINVDSQKLDMTVVIDCLHGATSRIAEALFKQCCARVIMLNDTPDGNFPAGNPDPTERGRLAELQHTVILEQADIGIAFDGDGDRVMVVDNSGKVVIPDHLLYLLAQVALTTLPSDNACQTTQPSQTDDHKFDRQNAAPEVIFDIKCAHHLTPLLTKLGAQPIMSKTGSSLMRKQLQTGMQQAVFAGELSGHFIFNDGYFIVYDDAIYASLRLLYWLVYHAPIDYPAANKGIRTDIWGERKPVDAPLQLTDITRHLPTLISTADHYLPLPKLISTECSIVHHLTELCHYLQQQVVILPPAPKSTLPDCHCLAAAQHDLRPQAQTLLPAGTQLTCIDGIRLDFAHGFGILRESNTSHSLTVRFAGDSVADLEDIQSRFVSLCRPFDAQLATQIANIDMV